MDNKSVAFLEIMIGIGAIGILAFLIFLISRYGMKVRKAAAIKIAGADGGLSDGGGYTPQWYEFLLAAVVVALAVLLLFWQFPPGTLPGEKELAWSSDTRSLVFLWVMLAAVAVGLIVFVVTVFVRFSRSEKPKTALPTAAPTPTTTPAPDAGATSPVATAKHESPSAVRLLGLLLFAAAYLILNWSYVPSADQYALMVNLVYPAGLVVALVMLFDKASRAWNVKTAGESVREWILCDVILFLFILSYLNLHQSPGGEKYAAMFWDFVNVGAFLLIFWLLDRKASALRFLAGYAYLIALPILLLIWRNSQGVEIPAETSWWEGIWPFFSLAVVFFVLEVILLIANREGKSQAIGIAKDIIFVILYVIILIAAIPGAPE